MLQRQSFGYWSMGLACLIFVGCSGGDSREYGSLSGMVTLNGKPAPTGTMVTMINPENGAATSAQVRTDGAYSFPRVQVGSYNVGFVAQGKETAVETNPDKLNQMVVDGTYKEPSKEAIIPEKYKTPETSGLSVSVDLGDNSHDFNL
ncbi:carboxypeptidase-like regulatory domain-containing protein [uncultured Rubinisphaera sp.]|uniref:carboxypeptidase-like regulatory domain-containing protein n=1 Tax=uncultured Rubinisphaera sp. TaxID=1678686 RepID=UPI0030D90213|tara:strand:- start:413 stop:853 length:441 start_codon:yes stop_codon:yes gene_type:complete